MESMKDLIRLGVIVVSIGSFLLAGILKVVLMFTECEMKGCDKGTYEDEPYCVEHMFEMDMYSTGDEYYESVTKKPTKTPTRTTSPTPTPKKYKRPTVVIKNPHSSYDEGYEDVSEGDDYDWDRYYEDPDYADGVDDAMEDWDW